MGVGGGISGGIAVEFELRVPSFLSLLDGIMDNPSNPAGALIDASTDVTAVALVGSVRASVGIDGSVGATAELSNSSIREIRGTSTQVEAGQGVFAVTASAFDSEPGTMVPDSANPTGTIGLEAGASAFPVTAAVSREITEVHILHEQERSDFD